MAEETRLRIDVQGITLAWGNAARWKAELRDESLRRHLARPPAERLRIALEMIRRRSAGRGAER